MNNYWKTFSYLLWAELKVFKQAYWGKVIDSAIWVSILSFISCYIQPHLGVPQSFALVTLSGLLANAGLMEIYPNAMGFATDLTGTRQISYELTLPIPSWLIILKKMIYFAITSATIGVYVLPIGKLLLGNRLDFGNIAWAKLLLVFVLTNIFGGAFAVWVASKVVRVATDHTWMRFVFPLWFLGGFSFTWYSFYSFSPVLACIDLINPYIYISEGIRAALLGQEGFINFWLCCFAIVCWTGCFAWWGIVRLKRQLDFV